MANTIKLMRGESRTHISEAIWLYHADNDRLSLLIERVLGSENISVSDMESSDVTIEGVQFNQGLDIDEAVERAHKIAETHLVEQLARHTYGITKEQAA